MHLYDDNIQQTLDRIQGWHEETGNPLFVWEAMAYCLLGDQKTPLPEWCLVYLRGATSNIHQLYCGRDFRSSGGAKATITPGEAVKLVPEALGFTKQGSKNAFLRVMENRRPAPCRFNHGSTRNRAI